MSAEGADFLCSSEFFIYTLLMADFTKIFRIDSETDLPEFESKGTLYTHLPTALEAYHLANDDTENLFAFIFPTVPESSRGTPHILEHSVLSGSDRYPVKDPFVQLMKGSMNTFLNAMTFPDKTVYPASSVVERDFFNLLAVYADAVFFPLLKKEIFLQEGIRFIPREEGELPSVTGVVFNEMQGNYSDAESIAGEYSYRPLFPGSPYRFDSGGEPWEMPLLTFEDFTRFHRENYHPSGCRLFLYGNISAEKTLTFLHDGYLSRFSERFGKKAGIEAAGRWEEPKSFRYTVPAEEDPKEGTGATVIMSWLDGETPDPERLLVAEIVAEALLSNPGSPLRKAVVESGLGEDLSPVSGIDSHLRQLVFAVGLRGTRGEHRERFESLVIKTLADLASEGIPERVIEGAMRTVEFRNREIRGGAPFGLRLFARAVRGWFHGLSPETSLVFKRPMAEIREKYGREEGFFERWIRNELVDNPHRATVLIEPDQNHEREMKKRLEDSIARMWKGMSDKERKQVDEDNRRLKAFQETPDSPEALAAIPSLTREDVPRKVVLLPTEELGEEGGVRFFRHSLYTNGVAYADIGFDTSTLTEEELSYVPIFSKCVDSLGLPDMSYDELSTELTILTGGFSRFYETSGHIDPFAEHLYFRLKTLPRDFGEAVDLMKRMLLETDFGNFRRLKDVLLEMRNDLRGSIIPRGHTYASAHSAANLSASFAVEERWKGLRQYLFITETAERMDLGRLSATLESIREKLIRQGSAACNVTAEEEFLGEAETVMRRFFSSLPSSGGAAKERAPREPAGGEEHGAGTPDVVTVPAQIGFAGVALPAAEYRSRDHALESILAHILKTGYLWEKIRMEGGAYGASAGANGTERAFLFSSYRDPRAAESLGVFRSALEKIRDEGIDQATLDKALIALVGNELKPLAPGTKGFVGFRRHLYEITDGQRQNKLEAMIAAETDDIREAARGLAERYETAYKTLLVNSETADKLESTGKRIRLPSAYSSSREARKGSDLILPAMISWKE